MNQKERINQIRTQAAIKMFEDAHSGCGEAHGFLWLDVNQAIVNNLRDGGFTDRAGGYDYITKGLVSMAARTALDVAKKQQAEQLTAAQARITELETALTAITNGYIHETASGWNVTHEFVEKSPLVKQARAALEMKP